jgi:hypothetical protein
VATTNNPRETLTYRVPRASAVLADTSVESGRGRGCLPNDSRVQILLITVSDV